MLTSGHKMYQCITPNCKCNQSIIHIRKSNYLKSKKFQTYGCTEFGKCKCYKCLGGTNKPQIEAIHNCGHIYYECADKNCTKKGRSNQLHKFKDGLFYCLIHFNIKIQQKRENIMPPLPINKIFKINQLEDMSQIYTASTKPTLYQQQSITQQQGSPIKSMGLSSNGSINKQYLFDSPIKFNINQQQLPFECELSSITDFEIKSLNESEEELQVIVPQYHLNGILLRERMEQKNLTFKQKINKVNHFFLNQRKTIYNRHTKYCRPGLTTTSSPFIDEADKEERRQNAQQQYQQQLVKQCFNNTPNIRQEFKQNKAAFILDIDDSIDLNRAIIQTAEEFNNNDDSMSEQIVTKEEFFYDILRFERQLNVQFPVDKQFLSNMEDALAQAFLSPSENDRLWSLSDKFIEQMKIKYEPKCSCRKCDLMFQPHPEGNPFWYLENFGCNFTNHLHELFQKPETYLFDQNCNQTYPLMIKDKEVNDKLNAANKILSLKQGIFDPKMRHKRKIYKRNQKRKIISNYIQGFKVNHQQYEELGGKLLLQVNYKSFAYSFQNNIKHRINQYRRRHHMKKPNPFIENLCLNGTSGMGFVIEQLMTQQQAYDLNYVKEVKQEAIEPNEENEQTYFQSVCLFEIDNLRQEHQDKLKRKAKKQQQQPLSFIDISRKAQYIMNLNEKAIKQQQEEKQKKKAKQKSLTRELKSLFHQTENEIIKNKQQRLVPLPKSESTRYNKNTKARIKYAQNKQQKVEDKWQKVADAVFEINNFKNELGVRNATEDIQQCYEYYSEPKFRYEEQEKYWMSQPNTLKSMAHDQNFQKKDHELTKQFMKPFSKMIQGSNVLTLCEGMSRNWPLLSDLFQKIDVCDIKPSFGGIPIEKQGQLLQSNLKDIGQYNWKNQYDFIFGCWSLCYIGYKEVLNVLPILFNALKYNGKMLLKEPILDETESVPRLCPSGQWMLVRPVKEIERWITSNFIIIEQRDIQQQKKYDTQRIWLLKKKALVGPKKCHV